MPLRGWPRLRCRSIGLGPRGRLQKGWAEEPTGFSSQPHYLPVTCVTLGKFANSEPQFLHLKNGVVMPASQDR